MNPIISDYFSAREPSVIRHAQIEFSGRKDSVDAVNVSIGNVSLPMHPAMTDRLSNLKDKGSPFENGVVKYTPTVGFGETRRAFLNIIESSGFVVDNLRVQVTDGGSQAMELVILGVCGGPGSDRTGERPLLVIDPAYTNYSAFAGRTGRKVVSITRSLEESGTFRLPDTGEIEKNIIDYRPGGMLVIPYDNPTGQLYSKDMLLSLAELAVKHNLWMISDEAYRELYYQDNPAVSIWGITDSDVPGIEGRRISIETASKVWNACGLRIGAIVTDNEEFHRRAVAENTANLCPNAIGQYIFGALALEKKEDLRQWYNKQRSYYNSLMQELYAGFKRELPEVIFSVPAASIYSIADVRNYVKPGFSAHDFVMYCAKRGIVEMEDTKGVHRYTLLTAPMNGFYSRNPGNKGEKTGIYDNPGVTQMRIAYVETPDRMELVPYLFKSLIEQYELEREPF
ncbi:MAG: aminotransferase class I/II-fold pyridoxal phosphate-dependent enzyme [Spirochaetes bacterium]|nr:aminotransferase class I/II-fold pyridoxal phosphate-dependent enzyme [Spirochaetota bacterium]